VLPLVLLWATVSAEAGGKTLPLLLVVVLVLWLVAGQPADR